MIELAVEKKLQTFRLAVDLRLDSGVTALFGPSGAGKTTLLHMIAGLLPADRGRIVVGGEPVYDSASALDVPAYQRRIGYVFQDVRLFPHMNVSRNLDYGRFMNGHAKDRQAFDRIVDLLDLAALLGRRTAQLSGGEAARVAIGRALLSQPRLLLLDEPLASLDGARKNDILPYLKRLAADAGVPILYVSHDENEARQLAERIIRMDRGRVVSEE